MEKRLIALILLLVVIAGCSNKEEKKEGVGKKVIKKAVNPLN